MATHTRRDAQTRSRKSWRVVAPMVALAAVGLTACSNGEFPSDVPGTTPPVWTGVSAPAHGEGTGSADQIRTSLRNAEGTNVGAVTFASVGDHVTVTVVGSDLTPGFHGLHVHSVGKCETNSVAPSGGAPGNFLSAGGHLQVKGHTGHPMSGDLPSLYVNEDGTAELNFSTSAFTLEDLNNDGEGTAIVVHEGMDNHGNVPGRYTLPGGAPVPDQTTLDTGDAGSRVACGVLK
ncbi:superoxide dismutase[Cu-Zn] [Rhodococcus kronopolitis]|uniref:Superoxide dismutase family protein n=1 Tax=Rhodococcus kronopolitis TaxID=1460226 RepID=A0ABV9FS13_9NOCA